MIRTRISLDPNLYERATAEARRHGISFAELVRRCLRQALTPEGVEQPWMRYAGTLEGDDPEASATIDDVVYGRTRP